MDVVLVKLIVGSYKRYSRRRGRRGGGREERREERRIYITVLIKHRW